MAFVSAIIILVLFQFVSSTQPDVNNYGPYKFDWLHIGMCKGPKSDICGEVQLENIQDPTDLIFRVNNYKDCPVATAKIEVYNRQNNSTKKLWNYVVNKPCQHFVLGPVLIDAFNLTSSCKIKKGLYNTHINAEEKTRKFFGPNFFYGSYKFKVVSFNKANNIFCVESLLDILKTA